MFFKKNKQEAEQVKTIKIYAPVDGTIISLEQVNDPVFAQKMLGDGFAIIPSNDTYDVFNAPMYGEITSIVDSKHAFGITEADVECLMHIGLDTVKLQGNGFEVSLGVGVNVGPLSQLVRVNLAKLKHEQIDTTTAVVFTNLANYKISGLVLGNVKHGDVVMTLTSLEN